MPTIAGTTYHIPALHVDKGGGVVNVMHPEFGATWDAGGVYVTNGDTIFNAALAHLLSEFGGRGVITAPPGTEIHFAAPHDIDYSLGSGHEVRYELSGVKLVAGAGIASIFRRVPASIATGAADALNAISLKLFIRGGVWVGDGVTADQTAIDISACYGGVIEQCDFTSFDNAVRLTFCLGVEVRNCLATLCRTRHFYARSASGIWTDATNANSGCNKTRFSKCRVYGSLAATSHFEVFGSSGCLVDDCICEGFNPVHAIIFNSDGATTARVFRVRDLHLECAPTTSAIKLGATGIAEVDGVFHQLACVLVDSTGSSSAARIFVKNIEYDPGITCTNAAGWWRFENIPPGTNPRSTSFWTGGVVPTGAVVRTRRSIGGYWQDQADEHYHEANFNLTGRLAFLSDNAYDIGQVAAGVQTNRPANIYAGTSIAIAGGTAIMGFLATIATLDFGSIAAGGSADLTVTVTGVSIAVGSNWFCEVHRYVTGFPEVGLLLRAAVTGLNTVTIRAENHTGSALDPASVTLNVIAWRIPA